MVRTINKQSHDTHSLDQREINVYPSACLLFSLLSFQTPCIGNRECCHSYLKSSPHQLTNKTMPCRHTVYLEDSSVRPLFKDDFKLDKADNLSITEGRKAKMLYVFKDFFIILIVCVHACVHECEGMCSRKPESLVIQVGEPNSGPLEEQYMHLPAKTFFQPQEYFLQIEGYIVLNIRRWEI